MHIAASPGCSPPPHPLLAADNTRPASLPPRDADADPDTEEGARSSPGRCPSRESRASSGAARCPSRDSLDPAGNHMAVSFPASLQAHSAVAALLGVGAHRLLPTSLALSASPPPSPTDTEGSAVLDFSTKRPSKRSDPEGEDALNLSKPVSPEPATDGLNSPLDLSVSSRKRSHDDLDSGASLSPSPHPPVRKTPRVSGTPDFKSVVSPWTSPVVASHFPYFAAAVAAASSLSPKSGAGSTAAAAAAMAAAAAADPSLWNGKLKHPEKSPSFATGHSPTDATKALEKMSELSKLGSEELYRPIGSAAPGSTSRHSAWQSHWLNKGADSAKDVLKCVWCKQSFPSLAALTTHMKEAKHCGVNVPVPSIQPPPPPPPQHPPTTPSPNHSSKPSSAELNLLIKETMPLPRKLVRGQDVWLGKGAEQTRQILKCMWCGQSFRSLAEMTAHMQQTQHYTNIISQEQIISWKSSDESKSSGGSSSGPTGGGGGGSSGSSGGNSSGNSGAAPSGTTSSHVSAVLTCKVCDQAFSSLKELSNHMVKNQHYKEHIMRSITESGGRRRQTREKRKKSLPVRKLLELERAQNELKNGEAGGMLGAGVKLPRDLGRDLGLTTKISCEKCGEKIETAVFVEHVRLCVGGGLIGTDQRNLLKSALLSPESPAHPHLAPPFRENRKCKDEQRSPSTDAPGSPKDTPIGGTPAEAKGDSPSVLNAIEKLIEKSFDSRARHGVAFPGSGGVPGAPMGSSILKRLGIDESVDYTKPLVDPQTMNLLRNYHHQQQQHMFQRRERSGSESSSVSERGGSSAGRPEALTPDRKSEHHTPRTTPDKRLPSPLPDSCDEEAPVKKEEDAEEAESGERRAPSTASAESVVVKKEKDADEEAGAAASSAGDGDAHSDVASPPAPRHTPLPSASPASSERSTPRSSSERKSSLGALSSMFDSLGGAGAGSGDAAGAKSSSHPLAALQKLCDKTETHRHSSRGSSASSTASGATSGAQPGVGGASTPVSSVPTPGSIVAFSWACNDAVMTADSIMKCAFCDTPFISKGAYRHHLSKMHFVKDGAIPDPVTIKAHQAAAAAAAAAATAPPSAAASSPAAGSSKTSNGSGATSPPGKSPQPATAYEESPHSKFLKYTELAKQLSSKYV